MIKRVKSKREQLSAPEEQFLADFSKFTSWTEEEIPDLVGTYFKWKGEGLRLNLESSLFGNPVLLIVHQEHVDIWRDEDGSDLVATIALDDVALWPKIIGHAIIAELVERLPEVQGAA